MSVITDTSSFHANTSNRTDISYSQISTWFNCPEQWFLQYPLGIRPTPAVGSPIQIGDTVHKAIAVWLQTGSFDQAAATVTEMVDELFRMIPEGVQPDPDFEESLDKVQSDTFRLLGVLIDYATENQWSVLDWKGLVIEREFSTQVWDSERNVYYDFAGHIDAVIHEGSTSRTWVVDFKTRKSFSPVDYEQTNLQNAIYSYLVRHVSGLPVDGTMTLEIKSTPPQTPKVNKDGSMSRSAIATDWATYKKALIDAGLNPANYDDMQAKLSGNQPINRIAEVRSSTEVQRIWSEVVTPAVLEIGRTWSDLGRGEKSPRVSRYMRSFSCRGCPVKQICLASLYGEDVSYQLVGIDSNSDRVTYSQQRGWL